jgi:hypothetical protein
VFGRREDMRKLLSVLFAVLLLGRLEAARACSWYPRPTDEGLFEKAAAVFVAHIVRAEEVEIQYLGPRSGPDAKGPAVEATFRLIEVLKGQPPADGKIRGPIPIMCMMPLQAGLDYVIFLNEGDTFIVWGEDKGTRPLVDTPSADDRACYYRQCTLEKLRDLGRKARSGEVREHPAK